MSRSLLLLLSMALISGGATAAPECKFKMIKVESKGDERVFSRCHSDDDCEVFASLSKDDLKRYEKLVEGTNDAMLYTAVMATAVAGGTALISTRAGSMAVNFLSQSAKNLFAPLSEVTPPAAGELKKAIAKAYGPKAAEIMSRYTYPSFALGTFGLPGAYDAAKGGLSLLISKSEVKTKPLVTGDGPQPEAECQDKNIAYLSDLKERLAKQREFDERGIDCSKKSGYEITKCREQIERDRDAYRTRRVEDAATAR